MKLQSKLFMLLQYSISYIDLQGTNMFHKNSHFITEYSITTLTVGSGYRYTFSIENKFITEILPCASQFADQDKVFCMDRFLSHF